MFAAVYIRLVDVFDSYGGMTRVAKRSTDDELRRAFKELSMPPEPRLTYHSGSDFQANNQRPGRASGWYLPAAIALGLAMIGLPAWHHMSHQSIASKRSTPLNLSSKPLPWRPVGLSSVDMMTSRRGWGLAMAGQKGMDNVYQTTSGGAYWVKVGQVQDGLGSGDLVFDSLTMDQAIVVSDFMQHQATYVKIDVTNDGGKTWSYHTVRVPGVDLRQSAHVIAGGLTSAWGDLQDGSFLIQGAAPGNKLYITRNGGHSWSMVSLPLALQKTFGKLTMVSPNHLWISTSSALFGYDMNHRTWIAPSFGTDTPIGSPKFWDQGKDGAILTRGKMGLSVEMTKDGGDQWRRVATIPGISQGKLMVANGSDWWVWNVSHSGNLKLLVTHDSGQSWMTLGVPQGLPHDLMGVSVAFRGSQYAFLQSVTSDTNPFPQYYVTHDGGRVWTRITPKARLSQHAMQVVDGVWVGN